MNSLTFDQALSLVGAAVGVMVALAAFFQWWMLANIRSENSRLESALEHKIASAIEGVRKDLSDKYESLREDMHDVDVRLTRMEAKRDS